MLRRKALGGSKQLDMQFFLRNGHESCFSVDSYHYSNLYRSEHFQESRGNESDELAGGELEAIASKAEACSFLDMNHSKIVSNVSCCPYRRYV